MGPWLTQKRVRTFGSFCSIYSGSGVVSPSRHLEQIRVAGTLVIPLYRWKKEKTTTTNGSSSRLSDLSKIT